MTAYDEIAERNSDDECMIWLGKIIDAKQEIVAFVDSRLNGGGAGQLVGYLKGSFNLCLHIGFGDRRQSALIRFAKPGHTIWRDEKVTNEVRVLEYLSEHTTIPLPRVCCWGLTAESPQQLGPFIIMDFVNGTRLSTLLKTPTENDEGDVILNPTLNEEVLDTIYEQLAYYVLQMACLDFSHIGAISKSGGTWAVTERPLTYNMNELATATGYPVDQFPVAPFDGASDYFKSVAREHLIHLQTQRNLASNVEDAQQRYIARHRFPQLISKHCVEDGGPFKLFCDDMQPSNMLVDPDTLRITAVLDFEFTNAMPAQFTYDPPWWLLLLGPDIWLERYSMEEFLTRYVPRMEQFLRALKRVEAKSALTAGRPDELCLSARMRESWDTGRFWFNYAARKSMDVDAVYWNALHEAGAGVELLDRKTLAEMESFTQMKMEQLKEYRDECATKFS